MSLRRRFSPLLRIDHALRYILLASLVLGMLIGNPTGVVVAARGDDQPILPEYTLKAELSRTDCCGQVGTSVGLSGNTAVLGAPGDGHVLVYERDANGVWGTTPLSISTGTPYSVYFGRAVAIDGDTIIASENSDPWYDYVRDARRPAPSVYIFNRNAGGPGAWGKVQMLKGQTGDYGRFGTALAITGKYLAVGSPVDDPAQATYLEGRVYLYHQDDQGVWQLVKTIAVDGSKVLFGMSLALDSSRLVVGAPALPGTQGEVYVYGIDQGGAGQWGLMTKLQPTTPDATQRFGWSVASKGKFIVVGAPSVTKSKQGAAYVFAANNGVWAQVSKLNPPANISAKEFGTAVAVDSGRAAVSTVDSVQPDGKKMGWVFLFERPADGATSTEWTAKDTVSLATPQDGDRFGYSLVLSYNLLLVGAPRRIMTDPPCSNHGAGYVFDTGTPPGDGGGGIIPPPGEIIIDLNGDGEGSDYAAVFHEPILPSVIFVPVPVVNVTGLTLAGPAGATLASATITLTNALDGDKEVLAATGSTSVAANYTLSNGVGVLKLTATSGAAPLADFQAALRSVTYANNSWKPNDSVQRVITFVVDTGTKTSNTAQTLVTVVPEKESPIIEFYVDGNAPLRLGVLYWIRYKVSRPAMVGAEAGVPSGTVSIQFLPDNQGCSGPLDVNGEGACQVMIMSQGNFTVTANYSGDGEFLPRTQSLAYYFDMGRILIPFYSKAPAPYDQPDPIYFSSVNKK